MFSLLIALLIRSEQFQTSRSLGVLLGAAAVCLLILPKESLPDSEKTIYVLVALIAAACYGAEGNYVARRAMSVGFGGYWIPLSWSLGVAEKALLVSSLIHALVYTGYIWLLGKTSAVFASQIAYIVTIGGVVASAIFLHERYSGWVLASLGLMVLGLFLVQPKQK